MEITKYLFAVVVCVRFRCDLLGRILPLAGIMAASSGGLDVMVKIKMDNDS